MINSGLVIKILKNKVIVLTYNGVYVSIKRRDNMTVGQGVTFSKKDICTSKARIYKYASIAACVAAIFITAFTYIRFFTDENLIYGYFSVDINPSIEFTVNSKYSVLGVASLDKEAEEVTKMLDLKGKLINEAVSQVIRQSEVSGYIKQDQKGVVLIAAALEGGSKEYKLDGEREEQKLESILKDLISISKRDSKNTVVQGIKLKPEEREKAIQSHLSMGKYFLFLQAKEKGLPITVEEARSSKVADLMKQIPTALKEEQYVHGAVPTLSSYPMDTPKLASVSGNNPRQTPNTDPKESAIPRPTVKQDLPATPQLSDLPQSVSPVIQEPSPVSNSSGELRDAFSRIEAESFDTQSGIIKSECYDGGTYNGLQISPSNKGGYTVYKNVDFGRGAFSFECRVEGCKDGNAVEIRLDSQNGPKIGICPLGDNSIMHIKWWNNFWCSINAVKGVHTVYLNISNTNDQKLNINWFRFHQGTSLGDTVSNGSKIALKAVNGKYVTAGNSWESGLIPMKDTIGPWETFTIKDLGNGKKALKCEANHQFVCVRNSEKNIMFADSDTVNKACSFEIVDLGNGNIALKAVTNDRYVCAEYEGKVSLMAKSSGISSWEVFEVIRT